ncbi:MAG: type I-U CRISPR-associated protein Cas7 [Acidobacteria bacterium]|nr:type I-U CRISPR-associated protein Cas7 [Acidobacteriota bacterium]
MSEPLALATDTVDGWADDIHGPVALHLKQRLVSVEGEGGVILPPTYADIGYNIDTLSDGTRVATIDSVGSQANRLEPIFKRKPYSDLAPQIEIEISKGRGEDVHVERRSLFDLAHRSADAVVHASPEFSALATKAFRALRRGDAGPLCALAPTSLVFGVWDSRGDSQEKRPRLVRSIIRAWDVDVLHAAAQFNSVWKALDEDQQAALKKEAKSKKVELSEKGLADAPAIFRKTKIPQFRKDDGSPNPESRILGGVRANGPIERDVTVNLVALRSLAGADEGKTRSIRRYILALALTAATADIDLFLREGCHLRFANEDRWHAVPRRGEPVPVDLTSPEAQKTLCEYAQKAVEPFRSQWPETPVYEFNVSEAKKLLIKKNEDA